METGDLIFAIYLIFVALIAFYLYRKGKKALAIFPDLREVRVLFQEKKVSVPSNRGRRNILEIIVTEDELWIKPTLFLAGHAEKAGILHRVELGRVVRVEREQKFAVLTFYNKEDDLFTIKLRMKGVDEFVEILRDKIDHHENM